MIGTEFLNGQGLGNQLFCYVSSRCLALDNGCEFGTAGQKEFANNIHSKRGMYFMNVDLGKEIDKSSYNLIYESEERVSLPYNRHDLTNGCYIAGYDEKLFEPIKDNSLIYGNLQAEEYFIKHKSEIKEWLKVDSGFQIDSLAQDDVCILNMRGGEYVGLRTLYLRKKYWEDAMEHMKRINPKMRFVIITEDVASAKLMFPNIDAFHFGMGEDYAAIHFAHYVIVSNSSFSFFPIFTSDTVKMVIAPKYWARHNVSTGYWASEQNIYSGWNYLDRNGKIYSAEECKQELVEYKRAYFEKLKSPKTGAVWKLRVYLNKFLDLIYKIRRKAKKVLYGQRKNN